MNKEYPIRVKWSERIRLLEHLFIIRLNLQGVQSSCGLCSQQF